MIVFIVQRNSPLTSKAKTSSCEREGERWVEDRSHDYVKSDITSTPTPLLTSDTQKPICIHTQMRPVMMFSSLSNSPHTCAHVFSCTNFSLFHQPPGLTAANSLLTVVKPHTLTHTVTFPSALAKKNLSQFIIQ